MNSSDQYSTIAIWVLAIHKTLESMSIDGDEALIKSEIPITIKNSPSQRIDVHKIKTLWKYAVEQTGNDAFGLEIIPQFLNTPNNILSIAIGASSNIREFFERLLRYYHIVSTALTILMNVGETFDLEIAPSPSGELVVQEAADATIAILFTQVSEFSAYPIKPLRIEFMRQKPKEIKRFESFFNCPLFFECERTAIVFSPEILDYPLVNPDERLAKHLDLLLTEVSSEFNDNNFSRQVYAALFSMLQSEKPTLNNLAKKLQIGTRTIQRRLLNEGVTFKELLNKARYDLACKYLEEKQLNIGEISYLLGFSSHSNFVRFFRKRSGIVPSEYSK